MVSVTRETCQHQKPTELHASLTDNAKRIQSQSKPVFLNRNVLVSTPSTHKISRSIDHDILSNIRAARFRASGDSISERFGWRLRNHGTDKATGAIRVLACKVQTGENTASDDEKRLELAVVTCTCQVT
jgi:hypothetical protein